MLPIFASLAVLISRPVVATESSSFLNFSSTAPYIFSSVSGLLEQWSNTFFPNGHTIAACEIPRATLFYHGRIDSSETPSPEWLAFDIEMSYGIMGNDLNSRILTYRTTRAVKAIYFDGTSASLIGSGTESQMIFLYGDSESVPSRPGPGRGRGPPGGGHRGDGPPYDGTPGDRPPNHRPPGEKPPADSPRWNPLADEYFRARGLCKWIEEKGLGGLGWGYEGIIRMNAGFEMIWCNFNSPSLRLISNLNVSVPRLQGETDPKDPRKPSRGSLVPRRSSTLQQAPLGIPPAVRPADEGPHGPGMTDPSEAFRGAAYWMWFAATTRRYGSSANGAGRGETRAKVQTCGLFSFYNEELSDQAISRTDEERSDLNLTASGKWKGPKSGVGRKIALGQLARRRRQHRTNHVSKDDGILMQDLVESSLVNALNETKCSDINWHLIAQEIVAAYAQNLHELAAILDSPSGSDTRSWLASVRTIAHWLMLPSFEYPPGPYTNESLPIQFSFNSPGAQLALGRCRSQYGVLEGEVVSQSEKVISKAIDGTLSTICNTIFQIGLEVEIEWLAKFNIILQTGGKDSPQTPIEASAWKEKIEELNAWLGWVEQWTGCPEGCKSDVSNCKSHTCLKIRELMFPQRNSVTYQFGQLEGGWVALETKNYSTRSASIVLHIPINFLSLCSSIEISELPISASQITFS